MRILAVSSRPPWPPVMADAMTVDRLLRFLAGRGHEVDLACFAEDEAQERELRGALGAVCRRIETVRLPKWRSYLSTASSLPGALPMQVQYFRSREMRARIESLVESDHVGGEVAGVVAPVPRDLGRCISPHEGSHRAVARASQLGKKMPIRPW